MSFEPTFRTPTFRDVRSECWRGLYEKASNNIERDTISVEQRIEFLGITLAGHETLREISDLDAERYDEIANQLLSIHERHGQGETGKTMWQEYFRNRINLATLPQLVLTPALFAAPHSEIERAEMRDKLQNEFGHYGAIGEVLEEALNCLETSVDGTQDNIGIRGSISELAVLSLLNRSQDPDLIATQSPLYADQHRHTDIVAHCFDREIPKQVNIQVKSSRNTPVNSDAFDWENILLIPADSLLPTHSESAARIGRTIVEELSGTASASQIAKLDAATSWLRHQVECFAAPRREL